MKIGYADPPYPGCAHLYKDHPDYGGEVDHRALVERLQREFDGWVLHTSAPALLQLANDRIITPALGVRVHQWVKPFAAFKRNVPVAYAYEPVIVKPARKPEVSSRVGTMRDWVEEEVVKESITMKRGLTGAKPERVCHYAFEWVGARPDDEMHDLFPGTGAVARAWNTWRLRWL